uniref:RNA-directed RNA polymerase n=1 Tax=Erysiphales associated toti-like virus 2 TaxID=2719862 RepID=A0A6G9ELW2_9VIRU|nr:RNA-dependent RNA polymerase [Erysiphales associated toti-like virus 2]
MHSRRNKICRDEDTRGSGRLLNNIYTGMGTPGEEKCSLHNKYTGIGTPGEGKCSLKDSSSGRNEHPETYKKRSRQTAASSRDGANKVGQNNSAGNSKRTITECGKSHKQQGQAVGCPHLKRAVCAKDSCNGESIPCACRRLPTNRQAGAAHAAIDKRLLGTPALQFYKLKGMVRCSGQARLARGVASQLTTSVAGPMDVRALYGYKSDYYEVHKRIGAYINSSGILQLTVKDGHPGVVATATYAVSGDVAPTSKVREGIWLGWNSKPWKLGSRPGPSWQPNCPSQINEEMKRLSIRDYKLGPMQSVLDKVDKEHLSAIALGFLNALEIGDNHIALLFALAGYLTECSWAEQINAKKEMNVDNAVYPRCITRWDDTAAMDAFVTRTANVVATQSGSSAAALLWAAAGAQLPKWSVHKAGKKYMLPWSTMQLEPTAQVIVGLSERPDFDTIPSEPLQVATIISEYVTRNALNEQWEVAMDLAAILPWCREEAWTKQLPKARHVTDFYSTYTSIRAQGIGLEGGVRIVTHINTGCASSVLTGLAIRSSIQCMINKDMGVNGMHSIGAQAKKAMLTAPMNYAQLAEEGRDRAAVLNNAMDSIMFLAGEVNDLYAQRAKQVHNATRVTLLANSLLGCQNDWASKALLEGWSFDPVMIGMTMLEVSAKDRMLYKLSGLDNVKQHIPVGKLPAGIPSGTSPVNLMTPAQVRRLTELAGRKLKLTLERVDFEISAWQVPRELFVGYHQYADVTSDGTAPDVDIREWDDVFPGPSAEPSAHEDQADVPEGDGSTGNDERDFEDAAEGQETGELGAAEVQQPKMMRIVKVPSLSGAITPRPANSSTATTPNGRKQTDLYARLASVKSASPQKHDTPVSSSRHRLNFHAETTPSPTKSKGKALDLIEETLGITGRESEDFKEQLATGMLQSSYKTQEGDELFDVRDTELVESQDDGWCGVHAIINSYTGMTGKKDYTVHKLKDVAREMLGYNGDVGGLTEEHMAYLASQIGHGLAFYDEQGKYVRRIGKPSRLLPIRWQGEGHVVGYKLRHSRKRPAGQQYRVRVSGTISMAALSSKLPDILDADADQDWPIALSHVLGPNWQVDYKSWLTVKNKILARDSSVDSTELVLLLASGPKPKGWTASKLWISWRKGKLGNHGWPTQLVSCPGLMPTVQETKSWERSREISPSMVGVKEVTDSAWWPQWMSNLWMKPGLAAQESYREQLNERFPVARAAGEGGARIRAHEAIAEYGSDVKRAWPRSYKAILSTPGRDNQSVTTGIMGLYAAAVDARPDIDRTIAACWRSTNRVDALKRVATWAEKAGLIRLTYINMWTARTTEEADWDAEEANRTSEPPVLRNPAGEDVSFKVERAITQIVMSIDYRSKTPLKSETWPEFWARRAEWAVSGAFQSSTGLKQSIVKPFIKDAGWEGRPNKRLAVDLLPNDLWQSLKLHPPRITAYPHTKRNELGNKARAIYGTDFESYAISAYAADGFEVRMLDQFEEMRPTAQTWFQTILDLTQHRNDGEMMAGFDYADFNIQHSNDSMCWFYEARAKWWQCAPISEEAKADKIWACNWMAQAVKNQVVIHKLTGREYRTTRGMFSGIRDTTNMNTLLSRAYDNVVQDEWREYIGGKVTGGRFYGDDLHQGPCTIDKAYRLMQAKRKANLVAQLTKCEVGQDIQYLRVRYGPGRAEASVQRSIASAVNGNWEVRGHQGREQGLQGVVQTLVARGFPTKGLLRLLVRAVARNRLQKLPDQEDTTCTILPKSNTYDVDEPILAYRIPARYRRRFKATPILIQHLNKECESYVVKLTERQQKSIVRAAYAQLGIEDDGGMAQGITLDARRNNGTNLRIPIDSTTVSYAQSRKAYIHELLGIGQVPDKNIMATRDPLQPYAISGSLTEELQYPKIRVMI